MTTSLDKTIPGLTSKLIAKYGTTATITAQGFGTYDVSSGSPSSTTPVSQIVTCVINEFPDALRTLGDGFVKDPDSIIDGDKKVMVAASALTFIPKAGDSMSIGGVAYNIIGSGSQYSGDLVAYYNYHIRKA